MKDVKLARTKVLNLIITGIPSIQEVVANETGFEFWF